MILYVFISIHLNMCLFVSACLYWCSLMFILVYVCLCECFRRQVSGFVSLLVNAWLCPSVYTYMISCLLTNILVCAFFYIHVCVCLCACARVLTFRLFLDMSLFVCTCVDIDICACIRAYFCILRQNIDKIPK